MLLDPGTHIGKSCFRFRLSAAQDDKVIRITHHLVTVLAHPVVQRVEIGICQDGGQNRSLGHSGFRSPRSQVFENPLIKKLLDQTQQAAIRDRLLDYFQ